MSVLIGIYVQRGLMKMSVYDQTTDEYNTRTQYNANLGQIILDFKLKFKEKLIKIYVVGEEDSNVDFDSIDDPLIHPLMMDDIDFTHYSPVKLTPESKILFVNKSSFLYEYVNSKNGVLEYKPVKCFQAPLDMENHLQLMLQFFEYELNQPNFVILGRHVCNLGALGNYLGIIKKQNKDFSSYIVCPDLYYDDSQKAIIYGRYLSNDNVQTLLKLQKSSYLGVVGPITFNFKINEVIPSFRAIDTYKPQTRLMGIDLGSSRTVVCVSRNGRTELVKIDREYSMPSVISFVEDEPIIGHVAERHLRKNPELVLSDLKRLIDTNRDLLEYSWRFGYCIEPKKSSLVFQSKGISKQYSTIEIYRILLQKLKKEASEYQSDLNDGKDVNQAVITVPFLRDKLMLKEIFAAAELLGLKILDIITGKRALGVSYNPSKQL
uniref:Uncharacterized protein n=1 Tax=Panagrolaimus sp. JU765 TaxID=591449 RepID=A0AC34R3Z6_9BILA